MAESPRDKTTRKLADAMEEHAFSFYATVYLNAEDADVNKRTIDRAKRLIKDDNPDQLVFFFISKNKPSGMDSFYPYISFYSHENLVGTRLIAEQAKNADDFNISNGNRKRFISKNMEDRYQGIIRKIREGKVFDLSDVALPNRIRRWGLLMKKNNK